MTLQETESAAFREAFKHQVFGSHGHRLHYVIGGNGDPVLLVPGWPQSWYAWRRVMPMLAKRFTVVAVDPPGLGDSDKPMDGYDTNSVALRLKQLTAALGWDRFHFVGHDIGASAGQASRAAAHGRIDLLMTWRALAPLLPTCVFPRA